MKKYYLAYSVVASASGAHPDSPAATNYYDITLADFIARAPVPCEPSSPLDSGYAYCARKGSIPRAIFDTIEESTHETRLRILDRIKSRFPSSEIFWASICDAQFSGIFDRETTFGFLGDIGAQFDDCGTLGTLGGPLSLGCVPDFPFSTDSQELIISTRVTPVLCTREDDGNLVPVRGLSEWQWEAVANIFRESEPYNLKK